MQVGTFYEKFNKADGNIYTVEEEVHLTEGVYEAELRHDNVIEGTFAVFTGPKLTGKRLESYTLSTPSLAPWKRIVRVYAREPVVYISYETEGDTVEAGDVNLLQAAVVETQEALNGEAGRAMEVEKRLGEELEAEAARAAEAENTIRGSLAAEAARASAAEQANADNLARETARAEAAEKAISDSLLAETERAEAAEKTLADGLAGETERAEAAEQVLAGDIAAETTRAEEAESRISADLASESGRAAAAETAIANNLSAEISRAQAAEEAVRNTISTNKPVWNDKYTRNEIDNKFSALETAIDWKEAVGTFADLAAAYPDPEDGWTVNVKDTDYTYRYSGTEWVAISANAIPKATHEVDGLMSKEDKAAHDDAYSKRHTHGNKSVIDKITQVLLDNWTAAYTHIADAVKHITAAERTAWNEAASKKHTHGNKTVLDKLTQTMLDTWNGKAGTATATQTANGLMAAADKKKLDGVATGANNYTHPATAGSKHIPSGGASGQILRWSASGTAVWGADNNTTYSAFKGATASAAGGTGLVPAPAAGAQAKYLRADGTWQTPPNTTYSHPDSGVRAGTYRSVTVNAQGHVTAGTNPTTLAGYGITDAAPKTHSHDGVYLKKGATWNDLKGE